MPDLGKTLIYAGLTLAALGLIFMLGGGKLPGDIVWRRNNTTVYFPVVTCIILSVVVSLIFWFMQRR